MSCRARGGRRCRSIELALLLRGGPESGARLAEYSGQSGGVNGRGRVEESPPTFDLVLFAGLRSCFLLVLARLHHQHHQDSNRSLLRPPLPFPASPSSSLSLPPPRIMTTRRPQFIFDDDEGDDSERDESRAVPAIVVQDAQTPPLESAPDLDEEERHVGWAPGTEGKVEDEQGQETEGTYPPSPKKEEKSGFDSTKFDEEGVDETPKTLKDRLPPLPSALAWIPPHLNWKGLRPVLRASLAAWCGLILSVFSSTHFQHAHL